MKAVDFDYERPASLESLCARLAGPAETKILAGGQTLVPLLAMRLARPQLLLDINFIPGLASIGREGDALTIGATTRQAAALADAALCRDAPLLAKALRHVGHGQTRNRGTIGGSLANADPSAEIGLAALALDGEVSARSVRGERRIAMREFFHGAMETALAPDECLVALHLPVRRGGAGFQELSVRASDFALAAVAVDLAVEGGICRRAAIAVGGAETMPMRIAAAEERLAGSGLSERDMLDAAALAADGVPGEVRDLAYRRRVVAGLAARAIAEAKADIRVAA